jgi:hypothetical protein
MCDHLMIYDAFAHLPIYGLEDLGFVPCGEAGAFIAGRNTVPGGKLPLNTNGGGLSYMNPACTACTHCRRACARCAASPPPKSPAPRSRSATASAACSPRAKSGESSDHGRPISRARRTAALDRTSPFRGEGGKVWNRRLPAANPASTCGEDCHMKAL